MDYYLVMNIGLMFYLDFNKEGDIVDILEIVYFKQDCYDVIVDYFC